MAEQEAIAEKELREFLIMDDIPKYKCLKKTVARKSSETGSGQADTLKEGDEIDALEDKKDAEGKITDTRADLGYL